MSSGLDFGGQIIPTKMIQSRTIYFFAIDLVGNREARQSLQIETLYNGASNRTPPLFSVSDACLRPGDSTTINLDFASGNRFLTEADIILRADALSKYIYLTPDTRELKLPEGWTVSVDPMDPRHIKVSGPAIQTIPPLRVPLRLTIDADTPPNLLIHLIPIVRFKYQDSYIPSYGSEEEVIDALPGFIKIWMNYGDIDGDDAITQFDLGMMLRMKDGLVATTPAMRVAADVRPTPGFSGRKYGDGWVTQEDIVWVLRKWLNLVIDP